MELLQKLLALDLMAYLGAATAFFSASLGLALLIPGEQPDKFLKGLLDLLLRFSKK